MTTSPKSHRVLDRAIGTLLGLAVGDALGGPLEFLSADEIRARHGAPVRDYLGGGWLSLQPGHGTDDTAMMLALARAAATSVGYDPRRALNAYLEWFRSNPPDVGATTRAALAGVEAGTSPAEATEAFHRRAGRSAGNGSLMRIAPIALRHLHDPERRARAARTDSKLTHFDAHAADACAWMCEVIAALLEGVDPTELTAPEWLESEWAISRRQAAATADGDAAGYVGTTLGVASAALRTASSFEEGLVWAVNLGGDADTNGAVAGALLGARFGAGAIPARWLDELAARDQTVELARRLVTLAEADRRSTSGGPSPRRRTAPVDAGARLEAALAPFSARLEHDPQARVEAEAAIAVSGVFGEGRMFVSHVPERDVLYVHERGYVDDGLEPERQARALRSRLADAGHRRQGVRRVRLRRPVRVRLRGIRELGSVERPAVRRPRFRDRAGHHRSDRRNRSDGPRRSSYTRPGAVRCRRLGPRPSRALPLWEECLAEGNELARYALGYTLLELDRPREAHEQLRRYSALVRRNAWAWCYLGQACERLEDWEGAEYAYRQALEATAGGSFDTDAAELLAGLLARLASQRPVRGR